ncbi:MAG: PDZ domain-containing protein, partial [bacterium]|nr:PDZ domain-containing protein [bacterium]
TASGIDLAFLGVEFTEQTAVITPASSGNASMWAGSIGQVSATFFKHFVVDINFDDMIITLIPPERFEYTGEGVAVPWEPSGFGPWKIPGTLGLEDGRTIDLDFVMDLGLNSQLRLAVGAEHSITLPRKTLLARLGRNIQGVGTREYNGRLKSAGIGGFEVKDVVAGFIAEEHSSHALGEAMVGLGLLSRFNLTFDFYNKRLFVEPNGRFGDPYELDMTGMTMRRGSGDSFEITRVHPNSPASEAGLEPGHSVHKVNGRAINEYDVFELRPLLRQEGATVTLDVERNGAREAIDLVLRRLI